MHKLILALTLVLSSAGAYSWSEEQATISSDWVVIHAKGGFEFSVPPGTVDQKAQGIDSAVGRFTGTGFELSYDYGWYSNPLDDKRYQRVEEKVDARTCFVATGDGFVGVYFPAVYAWDPTIKLQVSIKLSGMDKDAALRVIRSVRFPFEQTQKVPVKRTGNTEGK